MTTQDLVNYYAKLLIIQYVGKPRAFATIQALASMVVMPQTSTQTLTLSGTPASGAFVLTYNGNATASINWNDSLSTIQTKLQAVSGLSSITVAGSLASKLLTVTFTGVIPPALSLVVSTNSLATSGSVAITITVLETDVTLPVAVQNAYNVTGPNPAQGVQLDVIGKYCGVTRTGSGIGGTTITLDDADFLTLIQFAIIKNNAGSSLATIQALLFQFFPGEVLVFDYANMQMSYLINSTIGSQNLAQLLVSEGLLPKPMGVQLAAVIYVPDITNLFGFRTYELPAHNVSPFNDYASYQTDWPWLTYADAIIL